MNLLSDISTWKHTLNLAGATNHEQLTVEILAGILRQVLVQELLGVHQPNYEAFVAHTKLDYVREASKFRQNKYYDSELGNVMPLALRGPIFPRHFPKATEGEFVPIVHLYNMSGMEYVLYKPWLLGLFHKYTTRDRGQRKFAVDNARARRARALSTANFR